MCNPNSNRRLYSRNQTDTRYLEAASAALKGTDIQVKNFEGSLENLLKGYKEVAVPLSLFSKNGLRADRVKNFFCVSCLHSLVLLILPKFQLYVKTIVNSFHCREQAVSRTAERLKILRDYIYLNGYENLKFIRFQFQLFKCNGKRFKFGSVYAVLKCKMLYLTKFYAIISI